MATETLTSKAGAGAPEFFDADKAPARTEKHEKSMMRSWIFKTLIQTPSGKAFIVPGSEVSRTRGAFAIAARNAVIDYRKSGKHGVFDVYASDKGLVIRRLA